MGLPLVPFSDVYEQLAFNEGKKREFLCLLNMLLYHACFSTKLSYEDVRRDLVVKTNNQLHIYSVSDSKHLEKSEKKAPMFPFLYSLLFKISILGTCRTGDLNLCRILFFFN